MTEEETRFRGATPELEGHIFYYGAGMDTKCMRSREKLLQYVGLQCSLSEKESLRLGEFTLIGIKEPTYLQTKKDYDELSLMDQIRWDNDLECYCEEKGLVEKNLLSCYTIIWGQMTLSLQGRVKAHPDFEDIKNRHDAMALLKLIVSICSTDTTFNHTQSKITAGELIERNINDVDFDTPKHSGTKYISKLIQRLVQDGSFLPKMEKKKRRELLLQIREEITLLDPPGRFLRKKEKNIRGRFVTKKEERFRLCVEEEITQQITLLFRSAWTKKSPLAMNDIVVTEKTKDHKDEHKFYTLLRSLIRDGSYCPSFGPKTKKELISQIQAHLSSRNPLVRFVVTCNGDLSKILTQEEAAEFIEKKLHVQWKIFQSEGKDKRVKSLERILSTISYSILVLHYRDCNEEN